MSRSETGKRAEDLAAEHLQRHGYRIVGRNYRCHVGEIDIISHGPEGLVFVEVRSRKGPSLLLPEETITRAKALRLIRLGEQYIVATGQEESAWRVDVIAVEFDDRDRLTRMDWFQDATANLRLP